MMTILISLIVVGWVAASLLGTLAYFMGEQRKPIHERNWSSDAFDRLAASITGKEIDYSDRIPAYVVNTYVNPRIKY
jgi:hypothetical protein